MNPQILHYPKCGTCRKALQWLKSNDVAVELRDITLANPTAEELTRWIAQSGHPIKKFFNTSGVSYRELNLKERIGTATDEELIALLAADGKLVKRPLLILDNVTLVGFNEAEWSERVGQMR